MARVSTDSPRQKKDGLFVLLRFLAKQSLLVVAIGDSPAFAQGLDLFARGRAVDGVGMVERLRP